MSNPMHTQHIAMEGSVLIFTVSAVDREIVARCPYFQSIISGLDQTEELIRATAFASIGILLYTHAHDTSPIGMINHQWFGLMIMSLSALQFAKHLCGEKVNNEKLRKFEAWCFFLSGLWMLRMAAFFYCGCTHEGLHDFIWDAEEAAKHAFAMHVGALYLSIDMIIAVVMVCAMGSYQASASDALPMGDKSDSNGDADVETEVLMDTAVIGVSHGERLY